MNLNINDPITMTHVDVLCNIAYHKGIKITVPDKGCFAWKEQVVKGEAAAKMIINYCKKIYIDE